MSTMKRRRKLAASSRLIAPAIVGLFLTASCGEDAPPAKRPQRPQVGKTAPAAAPAAQGSRLATYSKIPEEIRQKELEKAGAFRADSTGDQNRDPFRSYVVRQVPTNVETSAQPTSSHECSEDDWHAPDYSLRDLTLIGTILRGTQRYADFRDSAGLGWMARRGDCIAKEKAILEKVGLGVVVLEVTPEGPTGGEPPTPETREIALHPDEILLETKKRKKRRRRR